jgi:hypothetical protein
MAGEEYAVKQRFGCMNKKVIIKNVDFIWKVVIKNVILKPKVLGKNVIWCKYEKTI